MNHASLDFDSLASAYDAWFEDEGKLVFAIEAKDFQKVLPLLPKPWLEIGVGSGRFAQSLGIEMGLDPSIKLLDMARKRDINVFLGRGEDAPIGDESLGTAFFIVTLCFVQSPLKVLIEANRLLKRNGKVVLGLVLRENSWGRFYQAKGVEGHRFYRHAAFYSYRPGGRAGLPVAGHAGGIPFGGDLRPQSGYRAFYRGLFARRRLSRIAGHQSEPEPGGRYRVG